MSLQLHEVLKNGYSKHKKTNINGFKLDNRYNKLSDKMKNLNTEIKLYYIKEINKFKQEYENLYREKHKKPIPESLYFIKTISDENNDITTLDKRFERLKTEILLLNPKYIFSE